MARYLTLLFLYPVFLVAQGRTHIPVTLISHEAGLIEKDNRFLYKDSKGYTWISSIEGLYRYDGQALRHFQPDEKNVTAITGHIVNGFFFEDNRTNVWFSTYDAINCYVRKTDSFQSYKLPANSNPGYFTGGLDSLGQLWFIWDSLLLTFNIESHQFDTISAIPRTSSRLLIRLNSNGVVRQAIVYNTERSNPGFTIIDIDDTAVTRTRTFYDKVDTYPLVVRNVLVESDTVFWIASHYGLVRLNPETGDTTVYSPLAATERIYVNHVVFLTDTTLFLVTYGKGAFLFDKRTKQFSPYGRPAYNDQPILEPLQTVYKDRQGGIWISVTGSGVAYFHPDNLIFSYFPHTVTTSQSTSGLSIDQLIEIDSQSVFASSRLHGAFIFKQPDSIATYYNRDVTTGLPANNTSHAFLDSQGRIWLLTASGPCIRYPNGEIIPVVRDSIFYTSGICETAKGEIILGVNSGGLYQCIEISPGQFKLKDMNLPGLKKIYSLLYKAFEQFVYGAADIKTLDIFDSRDLSLIKSIPFSHYANCMQTMPGGQEVWIGTNEGIFIYLPKSDSLYQPTWLSKLSKTTVYAVLPVDRQISWLSTNAGIIKLDHQQQTYQHFNYGHRTGPLKFIPYAGLHRSNGEIWFGSQDGITVLFPGKPLKEVPMGEIHIQRIWINDAVADQLVCNETGATNVDEIRVIRLPFAMNTLSFELAAFEYTGPGHVILEYRLQGFDTIWTQVDDRRIVRFPNLQPGSYQFEVRADNGVSQDDPAIRKLAIEIVAPLHRKPWFLSAMLVILAGSAFWLFRLNDKRKQKMQQLVFERKLALEAERLRISNDMHDDLGSGLSALHLRTKLLGDRITDPELRDQMKEVITSTEKLAQQIRETIWTVNSRNDTMDSLVTRLHQYALEYFDGTNISCSVDLMPEQSTIPIPGAVRREILLCYKEALHNIVKHAHATAVSIGLHLDEQQKLVITIRDNGSGFDTAMHYAGQGIQSMTSRIQRIGGKIAIVSGATGTLVRFQYPA